MSPDERFARVEQSVADLKDDLADIKRSLQHLEALANMGRGALALLLKLGVVVAAFTAAGAWIYKEFGTKVPH